MNRDPKSLKEVQAMDDAGRTRYFEQRAEYFSDSPLRLYAIRVGSKLLTSKDTMDLREQFDRLLKDEE